MSEWKAVLRGDQGSTSTLEISTNLLGKKLLCIVVWGPALAVAVAVVVAVVEVEVVLSS